MHFWAFLTGAIFFLGGVYVFRRDRRRVMNAVRRSATLIAVTRTAAGAGQYWGVWFDSIVEVTMPDGSLKRMKLRSTSKPREPLEVAMLPKGLVIVGKPEQAGKATILWLMSGLLLAYGVAGALLV